MDDVLLKIESLSFSYQNEKVLSHFSLDVSAGEIVAILGESGCGKSTLLQLINGYLSPEEGTMFFEGKKLLGPKGNLLPGVPNMHYVAQDFKLMPNHTVGENIGQGFSYVHQEAREQKIRELLSLVDMQDFISQKVKKLSGGQQQRVALAKTLGLPSALLLLDEPFSQIDNFRKNAIRQKIFQYCKHNTIAVLLVTHDIQDALAYSDRIGIMKNGELIHVSTPEELYHHPPSDYVASLLGMVNILPTQLFGKRYVYPHEIQEVTNGVKGIVRNSLFMGRNYMYEVEIQDYIIYFEGNKPKKTGELVVLGTPK